MRRNVSAAVSVIAIAAVAAVGAPAAGAKVLRVGSYKGMPGQFKTIQAALKAAKPNDWILVGPGDYKTTSNSSPKGQGGNFPAGVLISTKGLYLRGMNRNTVIVDGTKAGAPCNDKPADQNFGPTAKGGPAGLNGVEIWKAANVWVQNMTVCNFLGGAGGDGGTGNEIWWNGGAGSGNVFSGHGYVGSYLNATSSWFNPNTSLTGVQRESSAAEYGIFSSNWDGGTWSNTYASNMNDSGYYIGACQQVCNQTINKAWGEFNALGYSGSNSGGRLLIENSQFDNNQDGFSTNSQNGDNPPPQDGACPAGVKPPIAGAPTCWVFYKNWVHNNNDPNVPQAGSAAQGPVGTGMSLSGSRNDTVMDNRFQNNNAWGVIVVTYPDSGGPCTGGTPNGLGPGTCVFEQGGNHLIGNQFGHNGSYGHPSNGDIGEIALLGGNPNDCYSGNTEMGGGSLSPDAAALQSQHGTCTGTEAPGQVSNTAFLGEVLCDSQVELSPGTPAACPSGPYPRMGNLPNGLHKLPPASKTPTMPNPCAGVPKNPWCPGNSKKGRS
jgi:hypothetical protein